nr:MAG TPA: hypothetical protein [Caudoviricetes sp.]
MADEKKKIEYYGKPTTIAKLLSIIDGVHGYSKGLQDQPYDIDLILKPFDDWLEHTKDNYAEAEKFRIDKANFKVADAAFITESNVSWTDTNFFKVWRTRHRFVHRIDGVYWTESGYFTATDKFITDNSKYFDEFYPQTMNYGSSLTDSITYDHSIESIVRENWHGYWDARFDTSTSGVDVFADKQSEWPYFYGPFSVFSQDEVMSDPNTRIIHTTLPNDDKMLEILKGPNGWRIVHMHYFNRCPVAMYHTGRSKYLMYPYFAHLFPIGISDEAISDFFENYVYTGEGENKYLQFYADYPPTEKGFRKLWEDTGPNGKFKQAAETVINKYLLVEIKKLSGLNNVTEEDFVSIIRNDLLAAKNNTLASNEHHNPRYPRYCRVEWSWLYQYVAYRLFVYQSRPGKPWVPQDYDVLYSMIVGPRCFNKMRYNINHYRDILASGPDSENRAIACSIDHLDLLGRTWWRDQNDTKFAGCCSPDGQPTPRYFKIELRSHLEDGQLIGFRDTIISLAEKRDKVTQNLNGHMAKIFMAARDGKIDFMGLQPLVAYHLAVINLYYHKDKWNSKNKDSAYRQVLDTDYEFMLDQRFETGKQFSESASGSGKSDDDLARLYVKLALDLLAFSTWEGAHNWRPYRPQKMTTAEAEFRQLGRVPSVKYTTYDHNLFYQESVIEKAKIYNILPSFDNYLGKIEINHTAIPDYEADSRYRMKPWVIALRSDRNVCVSGVDGAPTQIGWMFIPTRYRTGLSTSVLAHSYISKLASYTQSKAVRLLQCLTEVYGFASVGRDSACGPATFNLVMLLSRFITSNSQTQGEQGVPWTSEYIVPPNMPGTEHTFLWTIIMSRMNGYLINNATDIASTISRSDIINCVVDLYDAFADGDYAEINTERAEFRATKHALQRVMPVLNQNRRLDSNLQLNRSPDYSSALLTAQDSAKYNDMLAKVSTSAQLRNSDYTPFTYTISIDVQRSDATKGNLLVPTSFFSSRPTIITVNQPATIYSKNDVYRFYRDYTWAGNRTGYTQTSMINRPFNYRYSKRDVGFATNSIDLYRGTKLTSDSTVYTDSFLNFSYFKPKGEDNACTIRFDDYNRLNAGANGYDYGSFWAFLGLSNQPIKMMYGGYRTRANDIPIIPYNSHTSRSLLGGWTQYIAAALHPMLNTMRALSLYKTTASAAGDNPDEILNMVKRIRKDGPNTYEDEELPHQSYSVSHLIPGMDRVNIPAKLFWYFGYLLAKTNRIPPFHPAQHSAVQIERLPLDMAIYWGVSSWLSRKDSAWFGNNGNNGVPWKFNSDGTTEMDVTFINRVLELYDRFSGLSPLYTMQSFGPNFGKLYGIDDLPSGSGSDWSIRMLSFSEVKALEKIIKPWGSSNDSITTVMGWMESAGRTETEILEVEGGEFAGIWLPRWLLGSLDWDNRSNYNWTYAFMDTPQAYDPSGLTTVVDKSKLSKMKTNRQLIPSNSGDIGWGIFGSANKLPLFLSPWYREVNGKRIWIYDINPMFHFSCFNTKYEDKAWVIGTFPTGNTANAETGRINGPGSDNLIINSEEVLVYNRQDKDINGGGL